MAPAISNDLKEWADRAGYSLTAADHSGAALFWSDPGGEIRYFVRGSASDGYTLTSSERAQAEQFELLGTSMFEIERYLYAVFSAAIRSKERLPRIAFPVKQDQIAEGYALSESESGGFKSLISGGASLAKARGKISGTSVLVKLSHLLSCSLEELKTSLGDRDGNPLFSVRRPV